MRTEQWIELLARDAEPVRRGEPLRRLGLAVGLGLGLSAALSWVWLGPAVPFAVGFGQVVKFAFVLALLWAGLAHLRRLGLPGHRGSAAAQFGVLGGMALISLVLWVLTPAPERLDLLLGQSWFSCPWRVALLSLPALGLLLWALRAWAPTQARRAGAMAGLAAGAAGALGYALHCPEWSPLFVLVWYGLGMLLPAALGGWLGPRVLRW